MFRHFSFVTKYSILLCALCVSAVQSNAQLADAQKAEREAKLLRKYDVNRNGKIDPD
jgi:regulator of RNase E activity RraB